jgi:hypothetical protein
LVLNPDTATVRFYDFPRNDEPKSSARDVRTLEAAKGDEELVAVLHWDA